MSVGLAMAIISFVLLAATIQRVAGLGFGMIFAPYAVVLIGAHEGIMLANFLGIVVPILVLPRVWGQIQWDRVLWLGLPAVAVMPVGAWLAAVSSPGPLYIVVASLVLLSLSVSVVLSRISAQLDGRALQAATGIGSGLGTVLGGVGGPAVTVYAVLSRWSVMPMVATLQPLWVGISAAAFGAKWALDGGQMPDMPWWAWAGSTVAIIAGVYVGEWCQKRVREQSVHRLVVLLAFMGALLALGMGVRLIVG